MPVLGSIKYPGSTHYDIPDSFLLQSEVDQLVDYAKSFNFDAEISDNAINIIDNSPGLNPNSFNVEGRAPLNEVSNELLRNMTNSMEIFKVQADAIQSRGYSHIYNEAGENYLTVLEEYKKRMDKLKEAVDAYNIEANTTYQYADGKDSSGNTKYSEGKYATCNLSYDLTAAPNLTFNEGTGPKSGEADNPKYSELSAEKKSCDEFYNTYVTDAIELKDKASACKDANTTYSIDKKIEDLLSQVEVPSLTQYGIDPEHDKILSTEEKGNQIIVHYEGYDLIYTKDGDNKVVSGILFTDNNIYIDISDPNDVNYKRYDPETDTYNNISIFDEENLSSYQYGADQGRFDNYEDIINDPYMWEQLQKYYPISSFKSEAEAMDFYERYCSVIGSAGCGYAAGANIVFQQYEGREKEFEETFGYPMYTVKNGEIDYNYEYFILDYYNHDYAGKYSIEELEKGLELEFGIEDLLRPDAKSPTAELENLDDYLSEKYNIECNSEIDSTNSFTIFEGDKGINSKLQNQTNNNDYVTYGGYNYDLYNMDGSLDRTGGGSHYMLITGYTDDGRPIVSSWGKQFILDVKGEDNGMYRLYRVNF